MFLLGSFLAIFAPPYRLLGLFVTIIGFIMTIYTVKHALREEELGDKKEAFKYYRKALSIFQQLKERNNIRKIEEALRRLQTS